MIWDMGHANNTIASVNQGFTKMCDQFKVFERGFAAVCDAPRDRTVERQGKEVTYPKPAQLPVPRGKGFHPTRHGAPRQFAASVALCIGSGGNGGVTANTIQDFLENIRAHPSNHTGATDLNFLFGMSAEAQKESLQDLTVIREVESKTVKHVCLKGSNLHP